MATPQQVRSHFKDEHLPDPVSLTGWTVFLLVFFLPFQITFALVLFATVSISNAVKPLRLSGHPRAWSPPRFRKKILLIDVCPGQGVLQIDTTC